MTTHPTATREEWLQARLDLLAAEKDLTHRSDAVAALRQGLPWVPVEKAYAFDTEAGRATLKDLFQGRSQLLVYHFMFGPDYQASCPSCSAIADGFNGITAHLAHHDVMLWAVSRAPLAKLLGYQRRMEWSFPWASSASSDFNADFNVYFTDAQREAGSIDYNYRRNANIGGGMKTKFPEPVKQFAASCGTDAPTYVQDRPGISAFVLEDGVLYHSYSAYARGVDGIWNMYSWLDRAPKGRNEQGPWWKRHDEYPRA